MALTLHWEWRAFGALSERFHEKYKSLAELYPPQVVVDEYLWVPGLPANLKFRKGRGDQEGLKFKRLKSERGELEQWHERPDEIYDFPLSPEAWGKLATELAYAGIRLPAAPPEPLDRVGVIRVLQRADARVQIVGVKKDRAARLWSGSGCDVKVELAKISSPRMITSLGLESWDRDRDATAQDDIAQESILVARDALVGDERGLTVMNYLQAVEEWAQER